MSHASKTNRLARPFLLQRSRQASFSAQSPLEIGVRGACDEHEREFILSEDVADCLQSLSSPASIFELRTVWGMTPQTVAKLLAAGILSEADETAAVAGELSDFLPRFLNCPRGAIGEAVLTFLGAPSDTCSQTGGGARGGPAAMRIASMQMEYTLAGAKAEPQGWHDSSTGEHILQGVSMVDAGDVAQQMGESAAAYGARVQQAVRLCCGLGSIPVTMGGDHSISYWTITGALSGCEVPISILHLDAHSDLSERDISNVPSNGSVARWLIEKNPDLPFVTVGLRGFLSAPQTPLSPRHKVVSATEYLRKGPDYVLSLLPEFMPCYISLDLDVLDPSVLPATNVPVPGGFNFCDLRELLTSVASRRSIVGIDVVELNPDRDVYLRSASNAHHLLMATLGTAFARRRKEPGHGDPQRY